MTIFFNKQFYHLQAIKKAVEAYQELAVFNIGERDDDIEVDIDEIDKNFKDVIKDEFCNYVLAETKRSK